MRTIWLTYDPDDGFEEHRDEEEGRAALNDLLDYHRDMALECVHDEVERAALFRCERVAHIRQTVTATAEDQTEEGQWCRERGWDFKVQLDVVEEEELSERAVRVLAGKGDGSPFGDLATALDEVERLRAEVERLKAAWDVAYDRAAEALPYGMDCCHHVGTAMLQAFEREETQ